MKISQLLKKEGIALNMKPSSKEEAIDILVDLHEKAGNISNKEEYKKGIWEREKQSSTAVGDGIAIPHAKNKAVKRPALAAMTVPDGVDFDSMDGNPAMLFFMIAAPEKGGSVHLEVLSRLSVLLMDEDFRKSLMSAKNTEEFLAAIDKKEAEKFGENEKDETSFGTVTDNTKIGNVNNDDTDNIDINNNGIDNNNIDNNNIDNAVTETKSIYRVLAVTACPTGIAHTFMAAEALEKAGKAMGISIKVETNGSGGAKNILTDEEIKNCDGIIVAADKNVMTDRFNGKPVLFTKVSDGIHKPEELINKIIHKEADIYTIGRDVRTAKYEKQSTDSNAVYKHLMNGVSHMLPFVIGGGIMIALAFLVDDYKINPANFGMNTPVAAFFKTVGNAMFGFMLPILAAYIASSIADRPGLAVGFAGGVLAMNGTNFSDLANGEAGGISGGFLAALFAGFLAGYIVKLLQLATEKLPKSLDGIRPMLIYPLVGVLLTGIVMCSVNPVMGWINTGIGNWLNSLGGSSKILLGAVVGGMMSIDMGGPFNKAAYVFGTASLALENYDVMAAVMVGGMVPPIAIALSTSTFKSKWSAEDRRNGIVNYIMGLCFISEGAIPYAAKDPIRVIPSCIIGSAVAGALSMAFNCTLRAPHGGIFVFPVVGNALWYIVALAAGSIVGAFILGVLKRKVVE